MSVEDIYKEHHEDITEFLEHNNIHDTRTKVDLKRNEKIWKPKDVAARKPKDVKTPAKTMHRVSRALRAKSLRS